MYNVVVAFRAQAYAAYSKMSLNPFKITSSARLNTAEILNDQKQTLSDFKIDLLSAPHCIIQSHLTMNSSRRKLLNMMKPRKVFTVLYKRGPELWFITGSTVKERFSVLIWD